jgi:hypothetical protein
MACRYALLNALRIAWARRLPSIGDRTVDRLAAGAAVPPAHHRLARLLAAAAGPPRGHELVGEQALLEAYVRAGRATTAEVARPHRAPPARLGRALAVKVAAGLAVLSVGSAAFAAHTGHLPAPAQQTAHDLFSAWGVPAPAGGHPPRRETAPRDGDGRRPGGTAATPPVSTVPPPGPRGNRPVTPPPGRPAPPAGDLYTLCSTFMRHRLYPQSPSLDDAELRVLAAAAGGEARIPAYCEARFGLGRPSGERTSPPPGRDPGTPAPRAPATRGEAGPSAPPSRSPESRPSDPSPR